MRLEEDEKHTFVLSFPGLVGDVLVSSTNFYCDSIYPLFTLTISFQTLCWLFCIFSSLVFIKSVIYRTLFLWCLFYTVDFFIFLFFLIFGLNIEKSIADGIRTHWGLIIWLLSGTFCIILFFLFFNLLGN